MATTKNIKYIYHLPFPERSEFCKIMNQNDKWEELAGMSSESPLCLKSIHLLHTNPLCLLLIYSSQIIYFDF